MFVLCHYKRHVLSQQTWDCHDKTLVVTKMIRVASPANGAIHPAIFIFGEGGWVGGNLRLFQAFAVTCLVGLPCRSERHWVQVGVPSDQSPWGSLQRLPSVLWRQQWPHGIHPAPLVRWPRATQGVRFSARLVPAIDSTWRVSQKRQKDLSHLWSLPHGNASKYKVRKPPELHPTSGGVTFIVFTGLPGER